MVDEVYKNFVERGSVFLCFISLVSHIKVARKAVFIAKISFYFEGIFVYFEETLCRCWSLLVAFCYWQKKFTVTFDSCCSGLWWQLCITYDIMSDINDDEFRWQSYSGRRSGDSKKNPKTKQNRIGNESVTE